MTDNDKIKGPFDHNHGEDKNKKIGDKAVAASELSSKADPSIPVPLPHIDDKQQRIKQETKQLLVGESDAIENIRELIGFAAQSDIPVMITGPSGSGKEVVANALHKCSKRINHKFVAVNTGAIPRDLLESELFGHEKGSFTGAIARRIGRFEDADQGTLFLDEIGDMPIDMQVKLLRVLEEKRIERIGNTRSIKINARTISATHRNLDQAITDGNFREDLFYRLAVFPIDLPPLGERPEDIMPLIVHFLRRMNLPKDYIHLSAAAKQALFAYNWPGNARELRNVVERAALIFPNLEISAEQLSMLFHQRSSAKPVGKENLLGETSAAAFGMAQPDMTAKNRAVPPSPTDTLDELSEAFDLKAHLQAEERRYLLAALQHAGGVVADAAQLVKLRRTTFVEKMKRYDIDRNQINEDASG